MSDQVQPNVSADLVWQITRSNNSFLVKRKTGGGVQFSRDPLNLVNKNSRKYAGFVNDKAVGIQASEKGGVILTTKKTKHQNRPAANSHVISLHGGKSGPRVYKTIVTTTAKQGYRSDLREEAVIRASRIRDSARTKKTPAVKKVRGAKAKSS